MHKPGVGEVDMRPFGEIPVQELLDLYEKHNGKPYTITKLQFWWYSCIGHEQDRYLAQLGDFSHPRPDFDYLFNVLGGNNA